MERVLSAGMMTECMKEIGKKTKCMEKDCLPGLMGDRTMESMSGIKKKDTENSSGRMEEAIRGSGKMENNMDRVFISIVKMSKKLVNGKMEDLLNRRIDIIQLIYSKY